jgi:hypothetical protein
MAYQNLLKLLEMKVRGSLFKVIQSISIIIEEKTIRMKNLRSKTQEHLFEVRCHALAMMIDSNHYFKRSLLMEARYMQTFTV